ncbi:hypothetical protein FACS189425_05550 [Clostridia bacterium]|nr:hypothetical protein FACS189425_05550 [Clostridia bacterium]
MNEVGGPEPPVTPAQFAQRIRRNERREDFLPRRAVALVGVGVAGIAIIAASFGFAVFVAIVTARKIRATIDSTWFLGFVVILPEE